MKQILSLALALLPCLAWAQYPSNGNQKITLGEQTTADGLVYRGVAADTTLTVKSDTAAYFVLDTVNLNLYTYKASASGRKWRQLGADTAAIAYVNTYGTQTVNGGKTFTSAVTATRFNPTANTATGNGMFLPATNTLGFSTNGTNKMTLDASGNVGIGTTSPNGKLDVSANFPFSNLYGLANFTNSNNGGVVLNLTLPTNLATDALFMAMRTVSVAKDDAYFFAGQTGNGSAITTNNVLISTSGKATFSSSVMAARFDPTSSSASGTGMYLPATNSLGFSTAGTQRIHVNSDGNVGIGTISPQSGYRLHVVDSVYVGGNVSASAYTTRSDYDLKDEIQNIDYGINEVMQMQPVKYTYKSNGSTQLGFIAQDLGVITPEVVSFEDKMSVYYNALIPILTKAIQEQNALIKALEQRIINLENK